MENMGGAQIVAEIGKANSRETEDKVMHGSASSIKRAYYRCMFTVRSRITTVKW